MALAPSQVIVHVPDVAHFAEFAQVTVDSAPEHVTVQLELPLHVMVEFPPVVSVQSALPSH